MLIALSGYMGAGKTHVAFTTGMKYKSDGKSVCVISFGDILKQIIYSALQIRKSHDARTKITEQDRITLANVFIEELSKSGYKSKQTDKVYNLICKHLPDGIYQYREIIQKLGTEIGREINQNIWADLLVYKIKMIMKRVDVIIIDDLRFLSEFYVLREEFPDCEIHYVEAGIVSDSTHQSEKEIALIKKLANKIVDNRRPKCPGVERNLRL